MTSVSVERIQANFKHYIKAIERGATVVVFQDNKPIAEIWPIQADDQTPRPIGLNKGTFEIPASFYDPLPPYMRGSV